MNEYRQFLESKTSNGTDLGFEPIFMPSQAFDFQQHIIEWAVRKGRGAIFADCGLGKTLKELSWAQNVVEKTNGNVLIVTVLSVAHQIISESQKFSIAAKRSNDGIAHRGITVTNYEQLHKFDPSDFVGVACDESSILKNFDGKRKAEITAFTRKTKYRLLASATPAPNDFTELGTSSECLGYLGYIDMLNKYFKNNLNNSARGRMQGEVIRWRFKGHAEKPFWQWVSSWSLTCRKPSDLGFKDGDFRLPELQTSEHIVKSAIRREGNLFHLPAIGLAEQRAERKATVKERCEKAAEIISQRNDFSVAWCHTNEEGDLLESIIDDCVQVSGKDSDESKESKFIAFQNGEVKRLVTKPSIGAWGLNFQHCAHMTFFPSHSFEQYYQAVRRFWRFGQARDVDVDIISTEGERGVLRNLQRKELAADSMFNQLVGKVSNVQHADQFKNNNNTMQVPSWL